MAQLPLPSGRLRVRAHRHHLGAAGRRERSGSAARSGADRHRVQGASVPASDDRLAVGSADDDARRSVRLLPPLLRPEQRDAGDRRRRRHRRGAAPGRASFRRHRSRAPRSSGCARSSPSRPASAALTIRKEGTTAYLKVGVSRAVGDATRMFFPLLDSRRGADRREGAEPVVELPRAAAAAQRAPVSRARRARPRVVRVRRRCCRPRSRFSTRCRRPRPKARRSPSVEAALLEELDACAATASRRRSWRRPRRSCAPGSCSTATASPTSRTSSGISRRLPASISFTTAAGARSPRSRVGRGRRRRAPRASRPSNRTIGWFEPLPIGERKSAECSRVRTLNSAVPLDRRVAHALGSQRRRRCWRKQTRDHAGGGDQPGRARRVDLPIRRGGRRDVAAVAGDRSRHARRDRPRTSPRSSTAAASR